jgi:hypothetical protein
LAAQAGCRRASHDRRGRFEGFEWGCGHHTAFRESIMLLHQYLFPHPRPLPSRSTL